MTPILQTAHFDKKTSEKAFRRVFNALYRKKESNTYKSEYYLKLFYKKIFFLLKN